MPRKIASWAGASSFELMLGEVLSNLPRRWAPRCAVRLGRPCELPEAVRRAVVMLTIRDIWHRNRPRWMLNAPQPPRVEIEDALKSAMVEDPQEVADLVTWTGGEVFRIGGTSAFKALCSVEWANSPGPRMYKVDTGECTPEGKPVFILKRHPKPDFIQLKDISARGLGWKTLEAALTKRGIPKKTGRKSRGR